MTSFDRKMARINRILLKKKEKDALSVGQNPAKLKYDQALKRLNSLQTTKDLDDFEKTVYNNPGIPEDDVSDEEYDRELNRQAARARGEVVPNEPAQTPDTLSGEQAKASAEPAPAIETDSLQTAKQAPPGGFIRRLRNAAGRRFGRGIAGGASKGEAATAGGGGGNLAGRARLAAQEAIKKAVKAIAKQFTKAALKALFSNPYTWIVIGAILLIFFAIVIPFSLLGQVGDKVSGTGKSWHQETNPTKDTTTIKQVLKLGGEQAIVSKNIEENLDKIKPAIIKAKEDAVSQNHARKDEIVTKADITLTSIDLLQSEKTDKNVSTFLDNIKSFVALFENQIPLYPSNQRTRFPLDNPTMIFNTDLHGGSYKRPEHVDNHGVYTAHDEGSCDAFDIAAEPDKLVYPVFDGQVVERSSDGAGGEKVVIKSGDYEVLVAHLTEVGVKQGDTVTINDPLGRPTFNHIHIETIYQSICLTTTTADLIDFNMKNRAHDKIGGYLYDNFKALFHTK